MTSYSGGHAVYGNSTPNTESPLASTENKQAVQSFGRKQQSSRYSAAEEPEEQSGKLVTKKGANEKKAPKVAS